MNKKYSLIIVLIMCVFFIPCIVNAEKQADYCKALSGDGKSIGSEIQCGTEHFYIVENKNNTIKMLAKYSLNVGDTIDYFDVTGEQPEIGMGDYDTDGVNFCNNLAYEKGYSFYISYPVVVDGNRENYKKIVGCRVYDKLNPEHVQQDSRAIGTKLDGNGKSILPLYGITYMNPKWGYEAVVEHNYYSNEYDQNGDLIIEGTVFEDYLYGYKTELLRQNIAVSDVSFITLDRTINLLKAISNKNVEVVLDYEDYDPGDPNVDPAAVHIGKMDINQYIPNNHKWIYGVTYWLGSGFVNLDDELNRYNDYYITNEGMLCALGRGVCSYFSYPIGNGVRPLVTINSNSIQYLIRTKTDGHGTIEVVDYASGGESIKFRVNSNRGYKLDSVTITTDSGEKVSFREGEIQKNSDGTMSIDKNNFTMPFENVTIQAKWKLDIANPNTGFESVFMIFIILVSVISMTIIMKRKEIEEEII